MIGRLFRNGRQSRLNTDEDGSALVELGLSLPMLCLMLLGAAEFARIAYAAIEVTNAAHSAAVYAGSSAASAADTTGITNAANSDSPNLTGSNAISVVTPLTYTCTCSNTNYTPTSCSDNSTCLSHNAAMITTVTVKTQTTFSPMVTVPGFSPTVTLQGKSSEIVSNN
ncbi:TadE/TadG family type IV pilus assembly protein [Occallatibacter savannae]|uniref:TadE/TadG family type IV pilus assembly protein n=1 Tax=Occallatibacter savannae TaxID=1002691 RepID=UPI000D6891A5|nr:TadE family protein [Occallatibacter savannae]